MTISGTRGTRINAFAMIALVGLWNISGDCRAGTNGPDYATDETEHVIRKMVDAHGGLEAWRNSPTTSFNSHLKVNFGGGNWVPFWEETTVETGSRRVYAKLPNADGTFGRIAFDGRQAWSAGELQGISRAPARFTAWRNFYLFNLPWMTQDAGVRLGETGLRKLPWVDDPCITVKMTFDAGSGDTSNDYYVLFIDSTSYRLRAAEYVMTYRSMMQDGVEASPPSIFVWEKTTRVNGLLVPTNYTVYWSKDHSVAVKDGEVSNWSFSRAFDAALLEMPKDATPDKSQPM